jgi:hypothetical protein
MAVCVSPVIIALWFVAPRVVAPTKSVWIACEPDSGELPALFRLEEITVGAANVSAGRGAGATTQNVLVAHELAVVFAERTGRSAIAGGGGIGAARPFPNVAEHLV